jgi:hypothetical protein
MDCGQEFVARRSLWSVHLAAAALAISTVSIGGCASTFAAKSSRNAARQMQTVSKAAIPLPAETRQKLDYEQQCYRASESIVRARLEQLQGSVRKMIKRRRQR